jgi:3-phosphoshikimate 1-carboxyvinyltransferase
MKEIRPVSRIKAIVRIPGSKSISHRALICASLARGKSSLNGFLACEDTLYTMRALKSMGIDIDVDGDNVSISGKGGNFPPFSGVKEIFVGNSGTSYRLLLSVAALGHGEYSFTGSSRMYSRPVGDLVKALKSLGVDAVCAEREGYPPVRIKADGIRGGKISIPGDTSSQYISSLLLAAPCASKDVEIEVKGSIVSRPYVELTMDVMSMFGVDVEHEELRYFRVTPRKRYQARGFLIEGDASSASYFWSAAAVTGGTVITENIYPHNTRQGDVVFLDILQEMGCKVQKESDRVIVQGGELRGVDVDMGAMPDMVPTLAATALFAEGKTTISNVAHLRHKESDRISDMLTEFRKLGGEVQELKDGMIIHGSRDLSGAQIDPHNDHRLAMSFAIVGLRIPGIRIMDEHCVDKSFPSFWDMWDGVISAPGN